MLFKDISYLELWWYLCLVEQNHLCNFGRRYHEEQFCEIILNLDQWFGRCRLKIFLIWSFGGPFVQWSWTVCAILAEGIKRNNSVIFFFQFGPVVQEEMPFKGISYLELWLPFCSAEPNHLCNLGRGYQEEQFCEIILNLDQWFRRRYNLNIFLIWSSGGAFVQLRGTICAILVEGI